MSAVAKAFVLVVVRAPHLPSTSSTLYVAGGNMVTDNISEAMIIRDKRAAELEVTELVERNSAFGEGYEVKTVDIGELI